ncbi:DEAD/DEAH box helicase [Nitrococcus mobilis]|uniref:Type III restriction enzyme, res subunit n=1 Tax=Nitrococcus mobilis Nb-231 TaxID=314278 RepID=A4BVK1_9GAMM|nr:DEAD/DEAH box helicase [Nitrococcus mobilis]EAR20266.1 Type III restriction enzyme, res subunit [Nitrococcus mobilis Nb-231]
MKQASLYQLLGDDLVDTLTQLGGSAPTIDELRHVAKTLHADNNPAAIQSDAIRNQLIEALPLDKAKELCAKLGIAQGGNIYARLKMIEFGCQRAQDETLLSFFGIVADPSAPFIRQPASLEATPGYGLFDYQREIVLRTQHVLEEPPRKALLHMPTGSGKTRTAMHFIARHLQKYGPTLVCWLANSGELLEQAADEAERSWRMLGDRSIGIYRFWGDHSVDLGSVRDGVLVAGFAKMHAAYLREQNTLIALGDRSSLTVVDEAHQAIAPTYRSVIDALYTKRPVNALLGLTATPGRSWDDAGADKELSDFFGGEKVTLTVKDYPDPVSFLIAEGYLANPRFRTLAFDGPIPLSKKDEAVLDEGGELSEEVLRVLSESSERNYKIITAIEELSVRHRRIIVFGASVPHAYLLTGILIARGHDTKVITSETPIARRERYIRQFKSDNPYPMVLCNYGVLTTGFDAPKTSAAVIARPTRSLVLYSQMVGRAIRGPRANGNHEAEIVTVVDTTLPGFGSVAEAFANWEDVWNEHK